MAAPVPITGVGAVSSLCPNPARCVIHGPTKEEPVPYDPHVFTRPDGSQILVSVYSDLETGASVMTVAERPEPGATWGPPIDEDQDLHRG